MPVIGEGERSVAELAVAQWGHRGQTGVIFSLRAHHVNWRLRRATALWEVLRPLSLTHQAFLTGKKDRSSDVTKSHGPLALSHLVKSLIDQLLITQDNHPVVRPLQSQRHGGDLDTLQQCANCKHVWTNSSIEPQGVHHCPDCIMWI